jgi:hypothetical protein
MYIGGMFWKQLYNNPDDGNRDSPWNSEELQPFNPADGPKKMLLKFIFCLVEIQFHNTSSHLHN